MRIKMMWIRILTAAALFAMLSQVNVWANTEAHLMLAVGYRTFLLAAPLFLVLGLSTGMRLALLLCVIGAIGSFFSLNSLVLGVFALGMAVSGYFAKYVATHTSQGAADNKVSLNIGSLISGLLILGVVQKTVLLAALLIALVIAFLISFKVDWKQEEINAAQVVDQNVKRKMEAIPLAGWALIGVATGIKLTGIFVIMPQYLIQKTGSLPSWFGAMIILNSLGVVFAQHRVLAFLDRSKSSATFLCSLSAMALLALPGIFHTENLVSATIWISLLTLGECALSRYDRLAREDGYLFPKEVMVGIGSFATVMLSRYFPEQIHWSGILGTASLAIGIFMVQLKYQRSITQPLSC